MSDETENLLRELIAATRVSNAIWLDAAGVGVLLSQEPRYVLERLACRPDFPKACRLGHPRWKRSEVLEWMDRQRDLSKAA